MPSDLHGGNQDERHEIARMMVYNIGELEKEIGSEKSIIIGDFNEMPYERTCLYASGMHGLQVLTENDKNTRIVKNIEYRKFYNPMWNLLGDFNYPPGTYYLNAAKICSPIMFLEYGTISYPAKVVMNDNLAAECFGNFKNKFEVESMAEMENMIDTILSSDVMNKLIQNLINESLRQKLKSGEVMIEDKNDDASEE